MAFARYSPRRCPATGRAPLNLSRCSIPRTSASYSAYATARANSGGASLHIEHSVIPIAEANRADSMPSASPHRLQSTLDASSCGFTLATQASQTPARLIEIIGPPQSRQSPGQTAFTTSTTVPPTAALQLRRTRVTARQLPAELVSCTPALWPGGPAFPSRTSSTLTLKTDLTRGTA